MSPKISAAANEFKRLMGGMDQRKPPIEAGSGTADWSQRSWDPLTLDDIATAARNDLEGACRARSQTSYLGHDIALARVLGRYKLFLDSRDRGFAPHLLLDGFWEIWLTQFIARRIHPGAGVIDVGANYGYFSVLMADLVGPHGSLLCLEPNPPAHTALVQSLALNGFSNQTVTHMLAAGSQSENGYLFIPDNEPKNATLVTPLLAASLPDTRIVSIQVATLDQLWPAGRRLDFMKIDTEGAEENVIAGAAGLIEQWHPDIVLEFNPHRCREPAALLATLMAAYGAMRIVDGNGNAADVSIEQALSLDDKYDRLLFFSTER